MKRLENKVALITGGTTGIGYATAVDFIQEGASVVITGRNKKTVEQAVAGLGNNAFGLVSDNGKMKDIVNLQGKVTQLFPAIDIVVANAGYAKFGAVETVDESTFDELFDVLVKGTYFTLQTLLPIIRPSGSIILITSVVTAYGSQGASVYSGAKAAAQSFIKTLAAECVSKNIRVNGISPGYTETEGFSKTGMSADQISNTKEYVKTILPLKRFADAWEIAKGVTFLASADGSYVHGSEIVIDGGYSVLR